jgi:hypothetical protein
MGLFSFIKEAGEKLFGGSAAQAAEPAQDLNAKAAKAATRCRPSPRSSMAMPTSTP